MDTGCKTLSVIHRDYFLDQTRTKPVIFFLTVWLYFASTTFTVGPLFGVVFMMVVFFFSCLWSEGWTDHGRTFSIYLCPSSFWLTLPELCFYWICIHCPCQTQNKYYTNYTWSPVHVLMLSMCGLPSLALLLVSHKKKWTLLLIWCRWSVAVMRTVKHVSWIKRMPWTVANGERW